MLFVSAYRTAKFNVIQIPNFFCIVINVCHDFLNLILMCCSQDMIIKEYAEMPTCNLAKTIHNKWLQHIGNKIIYLYKATMDIMICAFMQITKYWTWLKGVSNGKGLDSVSLKLEAVTMSGYPINCWLMP